MALVIQDNADRLLKPPRELWINRQLPGSLLKVWHGGYLNLHKNKKGMQGFYESKNLKMVSPWHCQNLLVDF